MARELSRPLQAVRRAASPPAASTSGRSSSCTSGSSPSATTARPVIIVSTELDEVLELADRIAVMYRGRIVGIVPGGTDRDVLGLMMAGVPLEEAEQQAADAPHHARARPTSQRRADGPPQRPTPTAPRGARPRSEPVTDAAVGSPRPPPATAGAGRPAAAAAGRRPARDPARRRAARRRCSRCVLALLLAAVLIAAADEDVQARRRVLLQPAVRLHLRTWTPVDGAYKALFAGLGLRPARQRRSPARFRPITETLTVSAPLIFAGLGLGIGFRAGPVQHRRAGPDHPRCASSAAFIGFTYRPAGRAAPAARRDRRVRSAARSGRGIAGCAQGPHRRQRGDRHDHAQLHRALPDRLPADHRRRSSAARATNPISPPIHDSASVPAAARVRVPPARRLPARARRGGRRLVADGAVDASASGSARSAPTRTRPARPASASRTATSG